MPIQPTSMPPSQDSIHENSPPADRVGEAGGLQPRKRRPARRNHREGARAAVTGDDRSARDADAAGDRRDAENPPNAQLGAGAAPTAPDEAQAVVGDFTDDQIGSKLRFAGGAMVLIIVLKLLGW